MMLFIAALDDDTHHQKPWSPSQPTGLYLLPYIDGLVQGRLNSIANALELRLSSTIPLI